MYLATKIIRTVSNGQHGLSKSQGILLNLLASNADKHTGEGVLSIASMGRISGMCRDTARRAFRGLESVGILEVEKHDAGNSVKWRISALPEPVSCPRVAPFGTSRNQPPVLIENPKSTYKPVPLCTYRDLPEKISERTGKNKIEGLENLPDWWHQLAGVLAQEKKEPVKYQAKLLWAWKSNGEPELARTRIKSHEHAQRLLACVDTVHSRKAWLEHVKTLFEHDKKPDGSRGHLVWSSKRLRCRKVSPRVVLFGFDTEDTDAMQWGPGIIGVFQRYNKTQPPGSPELILAEDQWRHGFQSKSEIQIQQKKGTNDMKKTTMPFNTPERSQFDPPPVMAVTSDDCRLWASVQLALVKELSAQRHGVWIAPLKICHRNGAFIFLACHDRMFARHVQESYIETIQTVVDRLTTFGTVKLCVTHQAELPSAGRP